MLTTGLIILRRQWNSIPLANTPGPALTVLFHDNSVLWVLKVTSGQ